MPSARSSAPLVSVLMPCFNAAPYLRESISSILSQSYRNIELIYIDDCSTDDSLIIASGFSDNRLKIFKNNKNHGIVATRNLAIGYAQGEFLACLDADDIALPYRIELQVNYLNENQDIAVVGSSAYLINEAGVVFDASDVQTSRIDICKNILRGNPIIHSSVLMRADLIKEIGGYPARYRIAEDYALWIKIAATNSISNMPDRLVKYRIHDSQISQATLREMRDIVTDMQLISWRLLDNTPNPNGIQPPIVPNAWSRLRGHAGTLGYDHLYWAQRYRRMGCWYKTLTNIMNGVRQSPLCFKFYWLLLPLWVTPWFWRKRLTLHCQCPTSVT